MSRDPVTLYGAPYSVYVRSVRLTLAEKGVPYHLQPSISLPPTVRPPKLLWAGASTRGTRLPSADESGDQRSRLIRLPDISLGSLRVTRFRPSAGQSPRRGGHQRCAATRGPRGERAAVVVDHRSAEPRDGTLGRPAARNRRAASMPGAGLGTRGSVRYCDVPRQRRGRSQPGRENDGARSSRSAFPHSHQSLDVR